MPKRLPEADKEHNRFLTENGEGKAKKGAKSVGGQGQEEAGRRKRK